MILENIFAAHLTAGFNLKRKREEKNYEFWIGVNNVQLMITKLRIILNETVEMNLLNWSEQSMP